MIAPSNLGLQLNGLSTVLGAWLSDRLLGAERVLFYSAAVVMAGHIALALVPGVVGVGIGLVLVLTVLFAPRGLLGLFEKAGEYFTERKRS